jgi:hypothetical protein
LRSLDNHFGVKNSAITERVVDKEINGAKARGELTGGSQHFLRVGEIATHESPRNIRRWFLPAEQSEPHAHALQSAATGQANPAIHPGYDGRFSFQRFHVLIFPAPRFRDKPKAHKPIDAAGNGPV